MKVLFINHEKELNGASMAMIDVINKLNDKCQIYILTFCDSGSVYETLQRIKNVNVIVHKYYCCRVSKRSQIKWYIKFLMWHTYRKFINIRTVNLISKFIVENKIDVVHTNTSVIHIGALIKKKTNVNHVWHIREFGDLDFELYPVFSRKKYWNIMNKYTDKFIFISKAVMAHYDRLCSDKKVLIYDGVDEKNLVENNIRDNKNNIVRFLIAGRICKTKGQYLVVKAAKYLLSKGITNFKIYIAGREIEELDIDDSVSNYIEKVGQINDLESFRKNIDVELVCSRSEGFGRIVAEAMLSGIPVIGSNTGAIPELVIDNKNGYLFNQGNYIDLAEKMELLIKDTKKVKKMGNFAREYAKERFLSQRCADEIYELYKSVL